MELTPKLFFIICPLVFLGSLVDAAAGGGGLITLPAYLLAGFPPHMASATTKCSAVFGAVCSAGRFFKQGKIHLPTAGTAAGLALAGAALGARLNLLVPDAYLRYVLAAALPAVSLFLLFRRDFGRESRMDTLPAAALLLRAALIGFLLGMYDGFFGPGTGTFLLLSFAAFLRMDLLTASGSAKLINLCSNLAAFLAFAGTGQIVWPVGLAAAVFSVLGHTLGAGLALRGGGRVIRPMFLAVLCLLLIRVCWGLL